MRTPWSFHNAVIPRLRAMTPVRMEFGVHEEDATSVRTGVSSDVAVTAEAFATVVVWTARASSAVGRRPTSAQNLSSIVGLTECKLVLSGLQISFQVALTSMAWIPGPIIAEKKPPIL